MAQFRRAGEEFVLRTPGCRSTFPASQDDKRLVNTGPLKCGHSTLSGSHQNNTQENSNKNGSRPRSNRHPRRPMQSFRLGAPGSATRPSSLSRSRHEARNAEGSAFQGRRRTDIYGAGPGISERRAVGNDTTAPFDVRQSRSADDNRGSSPRRRQRSGSAILCQSAGLIPEDW